jgi:hypothetical protein
MQHGRGGGIITPQPLRPSAITVVLLGTRSNFRASRPGVDQLNISNSRERRAALLGAPARRVSSNNRSRTIHWIHLQRGDLVEPPSTNGWQTIWRLPNDFVCHSPRKRAVWIWPRSFAAADETADESHLLGCIRDDLSALVVPWMIRVRIGHVRNRDKLHNRIVGAPTLPRWAPPSTDACAVVVVHAPVAQPWQLGSDHRFVRSGINRRQKHGLPPRRLAAEWSRHWELQRWRSDAVELLPAPAAAGRDHNEHPGGRFARLPPSLEQLRVPGAHVGQWRLLAREYCDEQKLLAAPQGNRHLQLHLPAPSAPLPERRNWELRERRRSLRSIFSRSRR